MNANKRTRSQLQIPEFDVSFGRSPLKDAKRAMRKMNLNNRSPLSNEDDIISADANTAGPSEASICLDTHPDVEDDILLSPRKSEESRQPKRSSSPLVDSMDSCEINPPKRPKTEETRSDSVAKGPLDMFFARQVATQSTPKQNPLSRRIFSEARPIPSSSSEQMVPATPTLKKLKELPEIDLRTMTPSPRKAHQGLGLGQRPASPSKDSLRSLSEGVSLRIDTCFKPCLEEQQCPKNMDDQSKLDLLSENVNELSPTDAAKDITGNDDVTIPEVRCPKPILREISGQDRPPSITEPGIPEANRVDTGMKDRVSDTPSVLPTQSERKEEPIASFQGGSTPPLLNASSQQQLQSPKRATDSLGENMSTPILLSPRGTTSTTEPIKRKKRHPKPITASTPRVRMTRAAALRQQKLLQQRSLSVHPVTPSKTRSSQKAEANSMSRALTCPPEDSPGRPTKQQETLHKPAGNTQRAHKPFIITKVSSLSPEKRMSTSGFSFSSTLTSSFNDPASKARSVETLTNLKAALEKLTIPPPPKPCSSVSSAQIEGEKPRPSTSMGFTRDLDSQLTTGARPGPSSTSRRNPVVGKKSMLPPPPPPLDLGVMNKDKGKGKALPQPNFSSGKPMTTGFGPVGFRGLFGKPMPKMRASQKTSLETVQGSPVKPSNRAQDQDVGNVSVTSARSSTNENQGGDAGKVGDVSITSSDSSASSRFEAPNSSDNEGLSTGGKELKKITKLNASRRASMAFSALSLQLASSQNEEGASKGEHSPGSGSLDASKKRTVNPTYAAPSSRPTRAAAPRSFIAASTPAGLIRTQSEPTTTEGATSSGAEFDGEGNGKSNRKNMSTRSRMAGSLDILKDCTIFVDVRSENGEDAGALFVDMLRGLGAKVLARVGQSCTHIVYKNGMPSTLTRYRLLDEPRPSVVGISWVVECVEKRQRIDEVRFAVDLEAVNVAGPNKRRKSILPRQTPVTGPMDSFIGTKANNSGEMSFNHATFSQTSRIFEGEEAADDPANPPISLAKLTPLDIARRRVVTNPR